ncbi:MAG: PorT family protein [Bacteroidetes bacterium]|nr:MAG: PorT family protein [Bacteroidota bacterium]
MKVLLKIVFSCLILGWCRFGSAQVAFGLRAGMHLASWSGNAAFESKYGNLEARLSFLVGGAAEFRLNNYLAMQAELGYIRKGFRAEERYADPVGGMVREKFDVMVQYMEVPVLLKVRVPLWKGQADLLTGPGFAYALNGREKFTVIRNGRSSATTRDLDFEADHIARFDFSLQIGLAWTLAVGGTPVFIEARYLLGLTDLNTLETDGLQAYNRGLSLNTGVFLPL